jgi:hypothetical protein
LATPLDQRTIRSDHLSGSFVDQTSCDSARVGWRGLFSEVMGPPHRAAGRAVPGRRHRPRWRPARDRTRQQKGSQMAMQFRVMVEIEGSSPDTFKIGFEFSDEEGSGIEFYSNHDLPEDVSKKLGALAIDFINKIGDLVLTKLH